MSSGKITICQLKQTEKRLRLSKPCNVLQKEFFGYLYKFEKKRIVFTPNNENGRVIFQLAGFKDILTFERKTVRASCLVSYTKL